MPSENTYLNNMFLASLPVANYIAQIPNTARIVDNGIDELATWLNLVT